MKLTPKYNEDGSVNSFSLTDEKDNTMQEKTYKAEDAKQMIESMTTSIVKAFMKEIDRIKETYDYPEDYAAKVAEGNMGISKENAEKLDIRQRYLDKFNSMGNRDKDTVNRGTNPDNEMNIETSQKLYNAEAAVQAATKTHYDRLFERGRKNAGRMFGRDEAMEPSHGSERRGAYRDTIRSKASAIDAAEQSERDRQRLVDSYAVRFGTMTQDEYEARDRQREYEHKISDPRRKLEDTNPHQHIYEQRFKNAHGQEVHVKETNLTGKDYAARLASIEIKGRK